MSGGDLPTTQTTRRRALRLTGRWGASILRVGLVIALALAFVLGHRLRDGATRTERLRRILANSVAPAPMTVRAHAAHLDVEARLWIDTDPSCGLGWRSDVDDCYAVIEALLAARPAIVGLSAIYGNARLDQTAAKLEELLRVARVGPEDQLKAARGAASDLDLGVPTDASRAIVAALERGPLRIVALGPLTTVATVIRARPDLAGRIVEIITVAGRRPGTMFVPGRFVLPLLSDLNFCKDLNAIEVVLASGVPVTLLPYQAGIELAITPGAVARIGASGSAGRWLAQSSGPWLELWRTVFDRPGFPPFDCLAVGYALAPEDFDCEDLPARVRAATGWRFLAIGHELVVAADDRAGRAVRYCGRARSGYLPAMMRRLTVQRDS